MQQDKLDIGKTLNFGTFRRDILLLAVFVCVAPFAAWFRNWFILAICCGFGLFQLYKVVGAQTALTLSPKGIRYAYDGIRFSIPWREISAIQRVGAPDKPLYDGVTVLTISRRFYDANIHTPYGKLLNPSRDDYFKIGDDIVEVAVYAGFLTLDRAELFAMIAERWRAFGPTPPPNPQAPAPT